MVKVLIQVKILHFFCAHTYEYVHGGLRHIAKCISNSGAQSRSKEVRTPPVRDMVNIHPCDMMWQISLSLSLFHELLLPLIAPSILPWAISSSSGLVESSGYGVMKG